MEVAMVCFKVLSQFLSAETEGNQKHVRIASLWHSSWLCHTHYPCSS